MVDGAYGFKGEDLQHGDKTLFIGIDAHADITRSFTNAQMFYPSVGKDYEDMWQSGYVSDNDDDNRGRLIVLLSRASTSHKHHTNNDYHTILYLSISTISNYILLYLTGTMLWRSGMVNFSRR